ncbi:MAG: cadherin repeat domain-containing protein [Psychrobium sp.]
MSHFLSAANAKRTSLSLALAASVSLLAGCGGSSDTKTDIVPITPKKAVVQTIAPDYSSSEVAYLDINAQSVAGDYYVKDKSDYTLTSYGTDVYHIGRFFIDTIAKYNSETPDAQVYSYSTKAEGETGSSNPYNLVFANANKAYLIRYASSKVWIINPNAANESDFKIGELDLAAYVPEDNSKTPSPSAGVIVDGKLYITMQRLSDSFAPNTAYVAVYDVATDTEIETNHTADDEVKGIKLNGQNPLEHNIKAAFGDVYVTSRSAYGNTDLSLSMIEKIETSDYSTSTLVSAADIADNTEAFITTSEIVSTTKGYFVASKAGFNDDGVWTTTSGLFEFNPTTGAIVNSNIAGTGSEQISFISVDDSSFLWVSTINPSTPGIDVINTNTNEKQGDRLLTELNPSVIRFLN